MVSAKKKREKRKEGKKKKKHLDIPLLKEEQDEPAPEVFMAGPDEDDPEFKHFKHVFEKLRPPGDSSDSESGADENELERAIRRHKKEEDKLRRELAAGGAVTKPDAKMSKKLQRKMQRMSAASLKQLVDRPDLVEVHDSHSSDPKLLLHLKGYRNTVPIPVHWCQKRRYLSAKRGFVKPPFELPSFIARTGISRIREAYLEREEDKKDRKKGAAQKRARIDVDFQEMHDAFFRHSELPPMSTFGEMFFEGREQEAKFKKATPGVLSKKLQEALGMTENMPPPWLVNMQRYGPPPSYPSVKYAGVNAPLPPGACYGYHPGGWGKAPCDKDGRPLYGDCFGSGADHRSGQQQLWGELQSDDDDDDDDDEAVQTDGFVVDDAASALPPVSDVGISEPAMSIGGTETPDIIELRKRQPKGGGSAFQVLEQQKVTSGSGLLASTFKYAVPGKSGDAARRGDVEVALTEDDVSRLQQGDTDVLRDRYHQVQNEKLGGGRSARDLSDAFAEERAQRSRKDRKDKRKGKDFKL